MEAVILAGGYGTRVGATEDYPKALHKVYGVPMIEWTILNLKSQGVDRIVLALAYGAEAIKKEITSDRYGIKIAYSTEDNPTGTSMAVAHALRYIQEYPVLVANGDTFVDFDMEIMSGSGNSSILVNEQGNCGIYLLLGPIKGIEGVSFDEVLEKIANRTRTIREFYDFGSHEYAQRGGMRELLGKKRVEWALQELAVSALAQGGEIAEGVTAAANIAVAALRRGNKIMTAGNGGGCAEAMHMAAELTGRLTKWNQRGPFAVLPICNDPVFVSAYANDYAFQDTTARLIGAYAKPGDVLVLFSTSGKSENLMRAAAAAVMKDTLVVAVTEKATPMGVLADVLVPVNGTQQRQQELMTAVVHALCDAIERGMA